MRAAGEAMGAFGMWKDSGLSSLHPPYGFFTPPSLLDSPLLYSCSEEYGSGSPQYQPPEEIRELVSFPRKEGKTREILNRDLCVDIENSENTLKVTKRKADQVHNFMDNQAHDLCDMPLGDAMQLQQHLEGDQGPGIGAVNPADDGYNWRKYGQKQIKGSKYPRSYYRCTHPTCQVKKRVERALDGHITEIIYMGSHNHPIANPAGLPASETLHKQNDNASFSAVFPDEDLKRNCQEMGPSVSGADFLANYSSSFAVDSYLSDLASQNGNEKGTTVGTMLFETGLNKRKKESCFVEVITGSHSHQPKVVVQTVSEVDTLEDGYRWRKYGQKVVKGNPNPRSYYKCTTPGCSVRKQIERAAYDIRSVITSYEGKHNHEVPEARRSNSICSGGIAKFPAHNSQTSFVTSEFTSLKPEPDKLIPGLRDNFEIHCEYLKSKSFRCTDDSEFLPLYQMMLQSSAPFLSDAFGLNTQRVIPMTKSNQELPIPYPTELSHSNFVVADDDISRFQCIGHERCDEDLMGS